MRPSDRIARGSSSVRASPAVSATARGFRPSVAIPSRELEEHVDAFRRVRGQLDRRVDCLRLECTLAVELDSNVQPGRAGEKPAPTTAASANGAASATSSTRPSTSPASSAAAASAAYAGRRGETCRVTMLRGRPRPAASAPSSSASATTSSPRMRCTHSSGRSVKRCASAGTAIGLHVLRHDEVAAGERGLRTRELQQREAAARARADRELARRARRGDDVDDVALDRIGDVHAARAPAASRRASARRRPARAPPRPRRARCRRAEHLDLVVARGVADRRPDEEPVELRLGQRVRALVLDRVLRRQHDERRREHARLAFARHLPLLHRLEQRGLRLRWGAVDLVGEEEVGEDRARHELELRAALVEDDEPVTSEGIRSGVNWMRENSSDVALRERARDERLREAGVVLEQDVAVAEDREQDQLERRRACRRRRARPRRGCAPTGREAPTAPSETLDRVGKRGDAAERRPGRRAVDGRGAIGTE